MISGVGGERGSIDFRFCFEHFAGNGFCNNGELSAG